MAKKVFALDRLLEEGWFDTEKEASAWIMERKVLVNEQLIYSAKEKISMDGTIRIKGEYKRRYVNKGGLKLEGAIKDFSLDLKGKVALDCGASTGGFTDCLIQQGAKQVYAVDVGFGQLAGKLMVDSRVINMEKVNLGDDSLIHLEPKPEVISLDLSYLSLKKALPLCREIMGENGILICLVKPIYEVESAKIRRSGKINDRGILREVLMDLCHFYVEEGCKILGVTNSSVTGNAGTLEFFIGLHFGGLELPVKNNIYEEEVERALERAFQLQSFSK